MIVATVAGLDGMPVNEYAQDMAESWGIGGKETEQGVLFLIAPTERKLRIHTNRGLQEWLPDVLAGRIIRDTVTPRFKAGDMVGGINAGVDAIATQLDRTPADAKAVAEAAEAALNRGNPEDSGAGSVIFWIFLIVVLIFIFSGRRRGWQRSGIDPGIVLWGASEIWRGGGGGFNGGGGFGGGDSGGGFGGFGGGGGGFDGGGASGDW